MLYSDIKSIIKTVKANHSCVEYLSNYTHQPISQNQLITAPEFIRTNDHAPSFQCNDTFCYDYGTQKHYDIIDLCALSSHHGEFMPALEELYGQPIITTEASPAVSEQQAKFDSTISYWHKELAGHQDIIEYLHGRRISDESISKYMIGYSATMQRLIVPYYLNGHYVYWAGRDMSGNCNLDKHDPAFVSKYQKCKLDKALITQNIPWGMQTLKPGHKTYREDIREELRDDTLCILEGMFDALSFAQDGWQVQSPVTGSFPKTYTKQFIETCKMYGRVFICFDNDTSGHKFQKTMCRLLFKHGIRFICGHTPAEINGLRIKDVSDYYAAGGELEDLVRHAVPGLVELVRLSENLEELSEMFRNAQRYYGKTDIFLMKEAAMHLKDDSDTTLYPRNVINFIFMQACAPMPEPDVAHIVDEQHRLLYDTSGKFYEYSRGLWREVDDLIVQRYVGEALGMKASSARMRSVTSYLKAYHAGSYEFNRACLRVFLNGTLHYGERREDVRFTASSPSDMSTQQMSFKYDPEAKCDKWMTFVTQVMDGNAEKIRLLQQIGGYVLCPDNRLQKFFYLIGDGRNGKSVFMNVIEQVYGPENCSSVQPSRLGSNFDPICLKDSLLNLCYESKTVWNGSEEALKAVVSGDPIMAAHKGIDAVKFKTRAKFIVAANKFFRSIDVSYGLLRRILFVKFDKQFAGTEDNKNLYAELLEELPGIFNWCLEGYLDLMSSGEFQETADYAAVMNEYLEQMSPTMTFARECLMDCNDCALSERDLYSMYKAWCDDGGFERINRTEFMKDMKLILRQLRPDARLERRSDGDAGGKTRWYVFPGWSEAPSMGTEIAEEAPQHVDHERAIAIGPSEVASPEASAQTEADVQANDEEVVVSTATCSGESVCDVVDAICSLAENIKERKPELEELREQRDEILARVGGIHNVYEWEDLQTLAKLYKRSREDEHKDCEGWYKHEQGFWDRYSAALTRSQDPVWLARHQ